VANRLAPRSQWLAITFLAAAIFAILLARSYQKHSPTPAIQPSPVIIAVEGDVKEPGVYLLDGPQVTIGRAIESAGGLRNGGSKAGPEDFALRTLDNGQMVQVLSSGQGSVEIRVETMAASARLTLGEKLNLNTSSEEDLMLVPQMKSGFAAAIVNRRNSRPWQSLDELEEIVGVGPRTIEKWRSYLTGGEHETKR
jgi:DNA uptake protein ComE-like DNA-binding protein